MHTVHAFLFADQGEMDETPTTVAIADDAATIPRFAPPWHWIGARAHAPFGSSGVSVFDDAARRSVRPNGTKCARSRRQFRNSIAISASLRGRCRAASSSSRRLGCMSRSYGRR